MTALGVEQAALTRLSQVHDEIKYWLDWQLACERGASPHPASPHPASPRDHRTKGGYSHSLKQSPLPYTQKSYAQSARDEGGKQASQADDGDEDDDDYQQHALHPRTVPYSCTRSPSNGSERSDSSDLTDSYPWWARASSEEALDAGHDEEDDGLKHARAVKHARSHHLDHESLTSQGKDELEQYLDEYGGYVDGGYVHAAIQARAAHRSREAGAAHRSIHARARHEYLDEYRARGAEQTRDRAGAAQHTRDDLEGISGAQHTRDYLDDSSRQTLVPIRQQQRSPRAPQTFGESSRTFTPSDPRLTRLTPSDPRLTPSDPRLTQVLVVLRFVGSLICGNVSQAFAGG
jgi:hypothetical protein